MQWISIWISFSTAIAVAAIAFGNELRDAEPVLASYQAAQLPADTLTIGRADTMDGLQHEWAAAFHRLNPQVTLQLRNDTKFSAEAFDALLDGAIDIAPFVREPFPAELQRFRQKYGRAPLLIAVATGSYAAKGSTHAIAIYVNAANPLTRLTLQQLDAIFSSTRRRGGADDLVTWGQMGLRGEWASLPIHPYGMLQRRESGNPPGIVNFMEQRALLGGEFKSAVRQQVDAPGVTALDSIVRVVAADPQGIGYSGIGNAATGAKRLALAETGAGPFLQGSPEEVAQRVYPLTRTIYLCIDRKPGQALRPALREFLRYVLSREGQQAIAADAAHFIPLPALQAAQQRALLD